MLYGQNSQLILCNGVMIGSAVYISNILDCLMCDDQEQRPFYVGWRQTCIIHRQLNDALQADEQVNKDRLVARGSC